MQDWIRELRHKVLGTRYVVVESREGDLDVMPVKSIAGEPHVDFGAGWTFRLGDDGRLHGAGAGVHKGWRHYIPPNPL